MKFNLLSLCALLALVGAIHADGADAKRGWKKTKPVTTDDCCPKRQFCCGSSCRSDRLQPLVKCAGPPTCCEDTPPPPPPPPSPKDCCPTGTFCCGSACQDDELKPRILCPAFSDCSEGCENPPVSDHCAEEPKVVGNCRAAIPRWSLIEKSGTCEHFSYGGCGGTENNFESEEECKTTCNVVDEPEPDCCPEGQFCCGTGCLPDGAQTFAPCGPNQCTCKPVDPEPCICTEEYMPLCNPKTGITYGNKCEAVTCGGQNPDDLVDGECEKEEPEPTDCCSADEFCCGGGCLPLSQQAFTTCFAGATCCQVVDPVPIVDCVCSAVFMPVCSKSSGKQYGNLCEAGCAKDPGPFANGACHQY